MTRGERARRLALLDQAVANMAPAPKDLRAFSIALGLGTGDREQDRLERRLSRLALLEGTAELLHELERQARQFWRRGRTHPSARAERRA
jgi:hypothetical protein